MNADAIPVREWTDFLTVRPEVLTWDEYTLVLGRTENGIASAFELYRGDLSGTLVLTGVRHAQTAFFTVCDERPSVYETPGFKRSPQRRSWRWCTWPELLGGIMRVIDSDRRGENG